MSKSSGTSPTAAAGATSAAPKGTRTAPRHPGKPRSKHRGPLLGTAFVHTVIDDHSRIAYAEIHEDETAATAIGVLRNAVTWFAARGVSIERVLSDNGSAYRSHAWNHACNELGITPKKTRPYRPQTNGKVERFHRTLADGWALGRFYGYRKRPSKSTPRLAPLLQSPPTPHRHRRQTTHHPLDQRPWAVQLGEAEGGGQVADQTPAVMSPRIIDSSRERGTDGAGQASS